MYLSKEISILKDAALEGDCEFDALSTVTHRFSKRLVSFAENNFYVDQALSNPCVVGLIVPDSYRFRDNPKIAIVRSSNPRFDFFKLHNFLAEKYPDPRHKALTYVSPRARVAASSFVSPLGVRIHSECIIEDHAIILPGVTLKEGTIVRAGAVIGTDGFEFKRFGMEVMSIIHSGGVTIGPRAEVQSLSTVAKAVFRHDTLICADSKLDCRVHIAHGACVGNRTFIAAGAIISGSSIVGDDVWIGPGALISNEISVGNKSRVLIGAVVVNDVPAGKVVAGNFARNHREFIRSLYR